MATYTGTPKGTVKKSLDDLTTSSPGHALSFNPRFQQMLDNDAELEKRISDHATAPDPHAQYAMDQDLTNHKTAAVLDHPDKSVTAAKLADGAATDLVIGNRTIDDSAALGGNTGALGAIINGLANMFKAITGKASWRTAPRITLEQAADLRGQVFTGAVSVEAQGVAANSWSNPYYLYHVDSGGTKRTNSYLQAKPDGTLIYSKAGTSGDVLTSSYASAGIDTDFRLLNGKGFYTRYAGSGRGQNFTLTPTGGNWYRVLTLPSTNAGQSAEFIIGVPGGHQTYRIRLAKNTSGNGMGWTIKAECMGSYEYAGRITKIRVVDDGPNGSSHVDVQFNANREAQTYYFVMRDEHTFGTWATFTGFVDMGTGAAGVEFVVDRTVEVWGSVYGEAFRIGANGAVAQNNGSYTTKQVRNIILSTADPSGGGAGDVWIKYS